MDILSQAEIDTINGNSKLVAKYAEEIDSESAYEMLNAKIQEATDNGTLSNGGKPVKEEPSTFEKIADNSVVKSMARTAGNVLVRSLLGALGLGGRSSKSKSWF